MNKAVSDQAREMGDNVERFVRTIIVPYEQDPRCGSHGPSEDVLVEMRMKAKAAGVLTPHIRADGTHFSQLDTAYIVKNPPL